MTYEEKRLNYFRKALKVEERRIVRYEKFFEKNKEGEFTQAYFEMVNEAKTRAQYYRDVVEMLEGGSQ